MKYLHADVFSSQSLKGNGLTIIFTNNNNCEELQKIAMEFKQFETVFIYEKVDDSYPIRIFTVEEELDFAGHPIIGASAAILEEMDNSTNEICFSAKQRIIKTSATAIEDYYSVVMNQGRAQYRKCSDKNCLEEIIAALNLGQNDISNELPIEVSSTGLEYLLIPVKDETSLAKSRIITNNFESLLKKVDAKFVYVFNPDTLECRTWDNLGSIEDVATGSAAGPLCAYLIRNGRLKMGEIVRINQGKFVGRPSVITAWMDRESNDIMIEGNVKFLVKGVLNI